MAGKFEEIHSAIENLNYYQLELRRLIEEQLKEYALKDTDVEFLDNRVNPYRSLAVAYDFASEIGLNISLVQTNLENVIKSLEDIKKARKNAEVPF